MARGLTRRQIVAIRNGVNHGLSVIQFQSFTYTVDSNIFKGERYFAKTITSCKLAVTAQDTRKYRQALQEME